MVVSNKNLHVSLRGFRSYLIFRSAKIVCVCAKQNRQGRKEGVANILNIIQWNEVKLSCQTDAARK